MANRITAVIPCFNEAHSIAPIVTESRKHVDEVIVVNNMSTDDTVRIAKLAGAVIVECCIKGAGAATRAGIRWALNKGANVVVTLDGDGQHDAREIKRLVIPLLAGTADLVIGSRFCNGAHKGKIAAYRKFGIDVINLMYNVGHAPVKDCQSGFRAMTAEAALKCITEESSFAFATEALVKARKAGFRIREVPVSCIYHADPSMNHSDNPVKHGVMAAWKTLEWRVRLWN